MRSVTENPIAAIATSAGAAGVCVIRISGAGALEIGDRLIADTVKKPSQRPGNTFFHARIFHPETRETIDDAVILVFRAPQSYTGEETLEIQGHGGTWPARLLLEAALAAGARLALPGEFTRRAFLNGRLDLTQAEAVCDFIQARTCQAARVARTHLDGEIGKITSTWYDALTRLCAEIEHALDIETDPLPDRFLEASQDALNTLAQAMQAVAQTWHHGRLLREGASVAICGKPNAGKSSLLNALVGSHRAIVHDQPGTTRDVIEEDIQIQGVPVRLADTAGLREVGDTVEQEGVDRARALMRQADFVLYLIDLSDPNRWNDPWPEGLDPRRALILLSKCDQPASAVDPICSPFSSIRISSRTGEGLDALRHELALRLQTWTSEPIQTLVSMRQFEELEMAARNTRNAAALLNTGEEGLVLAAGRMRDAAEALGRITGRVFSEDLLDRLFQRFCVGK